MTDNLQPLDWTAPGPGQWALDRSHVNRPATPINQWVQSTGTARGTRRLFAEIGAPLDALDFRFVNGLVYSRVRPLIRPDSPAAKLPPLGALRLATRLHPGMRRRRKLAEHTLESRMWREVLEQWRAPDGIRSECERRNLAIQETDRGSLDDEALVAHVHEVLNHALEFWELHFWLHGFDLCPIGLLLVWGRDHGFSSDELLPLLEGASPSTSEAERVLWRIKSSVARAGAHPRNLAEMRAVSPEIAADIDAFLRIRGALIFSRYDIDGLCLAEAPEVLFASIQAARDVDERQAETAERVSTLTNRIRERIAESERDEFDQALTEARASMDLRDDNGPHTLEWPLGLTRLALLEVGRRLAARGWAHDATHALELHRHEVTIDLLSGRGPSADELAGRAIWRSAVDVSAAPRIIGGPEPAPPLEVLPTPLARIASFVQAVIAEAGLDGSENTSGLRGIGIGTGVYRGRVCRADSPEQAIALLEDGDVLVVPCTTPAYNMILPLAGAIVTAEGGALSHAAILARELGLPAVIGAPRAMDDLPHGASVEVDADSGEVRVVTRT